jgi:hypothetical protein
MNTKIKVALILGVIALSIVPAQVVMAGKTVFSDGNPAMGLKGTKASAAFLNSVNNHFCTGLDVNGDCALAYSAATGTNDLITTITPTSAFPAAYVTGMPISLKSAATNTGAMTVNVNGLGVKAIKKGVNQALVAGDVQSGALITVQYDGTNFQLLNYPVASTATLDGAGKIAWAAKPAWRGASAKNASGGLFQTVNSTLVAAYMDTNINDTDNIHVVSSQTFTVSIATPAVFTAIAHGFSVNDAIYLTTTGALPTGLFANTICYVIATGLTADNFRVSLTPGGSAVNTSGTQSGTHTVKKGSRFVVPSGVSRVRLWGGCANFGDSTLPSAVSLQFVKNGFSFDGGSPMVRDAGAVPNPVATSVVSVVPGDVFGLIMTCTGGTNVQFGDCQAQMEIVE